MFSYRIYQRIANSLHKKWDAALFELLLKKKRQSKKGEGIIKYSRSRRSQYVSDKLKQDTMQKCFSNIGINVLLGFYLKM